MDLIRADYLKKKKNGMQEEIKKLDPLKLSKGTGVLGRISGQYSFSQIIDQAPTYIYYQILKIS